MSAHLGQVPWKVDVDTVHDSQVVRQELQRNDVDQTLQAVDSAGDTDGPILGINGVVLFVANNDWKNAKSRSRMRNFGSLKRQVAESIERLTGLTLSGSHLGQSALNLGVERILSHDEDDGQVLVDQGKRSVLELSSKDTLRVHIRNLLDFQSSLETGGELVASAHDQQRLFLCERLLGQLLQSLVLHQDGLDLSGNVVQSVDNLLSALLLGNGVIRKLESHHDESDVLRGVSLGGGDTNLGTGVDVDTGMTLTRQGRTDSVDDTQTQCTPLQTVSHGQNGVGSFSRLRDKDGDIVSKNRGLSVEEVGS